jgi:type II secretory pathway pseudopilin PulG
MPLHRRSRRTGLSLVELLLVIAIVGVAVGLIAPVVINARREAARRQTIDNLRQLVVAAHGAHDTNKKFPPYWGIYPPRKRAVWWCVGEPVERSLYFHLLPFLDGKTIYAATPAVAPAFEVFLSPLDPTTGDGTNGKEGVTSLLANQAAFCTTPKAPQPSTYTRMPASFRDGTSNCIFFATAVGLPNDPTAHVWTGQTAWFWDVNGSRWPRPLPEQLEKALPQQPYQLLPTGALVAMGDASVRSVAPDVFIGDWADDCNPQRSYTHGSDWDQ